MKGQSDCPHCEFLKRFDTTDSREFWHYEETFEYLHGSKGCRSTGKLANGRKAKPYQPEGTIKPIQEGPMKGNLKLLPSRPKPNTPPIPLPKKE